jgi:2-keto-4-pentenoate hydratase/2-oxohepta-3-ene-1,7-dioic acid hydratase in catechol pathway
MSTSVLRTAEGWWALTPGGAAWIDTHATTTAGLLADREAIASAAASAGAVPVGNLSLISPVTRPCRVVAQMTNFASHVTDTGGNPASVPLTFFRKSSGSISGPFDAVIRPAHVRLLDYEVEIGLVIGAEIPVGTTVTEDSLAECVAGLVVTNDISARDIQLPQTQFYEAKSYPTFTPCGPALVLLDPGDLKRFADLRLTLRVNGEVRQNMTAADMIYPPVQALRALTRFQRLDRGDLVLTGTPAGTALSAPPRLVQLLASFLPERVKWRLFFRGQAGNAKYLRDGDVIEATVATDDGTITLGTQHTVVQHTLVRHP